MVTHSAKILVVDDDPGLLKLLVDTLSSIGYHINGVKNGEEALVALENDQYDLVISDILMPGMDGISLLKFIREKYNDLPVLFISGIDAPEIKAHVKPNGFIAKPFRINKIEELIQDCLKK